MGSTVSLQDVFDAAGASIVWFMIALLNQGGVKVKQKSGKTKEPAVRVVRDIRRASRKQYSVEKKIRIVLEGLHGEESIAERNFLVARRKYC